MSRLDKVRIGSSESSILKETDQKVYPLATNLLIAELNPSQIGQIEAKTQYNGFALTLK